MTISEEQTVVLIETALPIEGMGEGKVELIGRQQLVLTDFREVVDGMACQRIRSPAVAIS